MSNRNPARAWLVTISDPLTKLTLVALAEYSNPDGLCWPALETLRMATGLSSADLARTLSDLEARGLITPATLRGGQRCWTLNLADAR